MQPQWVSSINQCGMDLHATGLGSSHFYSISSCVREVSYGCSYGVKGPELYPFSDFYFISRTPVEKPI